MLAVDVGNFAGYSAIVVALIGVAYQAIDKRTERRERREAEARAASRDRKTAEVSSAQAAIDKALLGQGELIDDLRTGMTDCEQRCREIRDYAIKLEGTVDELRRELYELRRST